MLILDIKLRADIFEENVDPRMALFMLDEIS